MKVVFNENEEEHSRYTSGKKGKMLYEGGLNG
jgi:hypothetical protein